MEFENIPQNIKDSLLSERVDEILDKIREEAGIYDVSLIPSVYYGLISKEIPAHYFIESLAETGIGEKLAKSIAKAIKERILESERFPLFKWGVDISEIKVEDAPDLESLGLKEFLEEEKQVVKLPLREVGEEREIVPIIKSLKESQQKASSLSSIFLKKDEITKKETGPVILQPKEDTNSTLKEQKIFPSFSLGQIGFFKSKRKLEETISETASKVRAEIKTPTEEKKVVHYSENRTTISPWGQQNSFLKTEPSFSPTENERSKETKEPNKKDEEKENIKTNKGGVVEVVEEENIINLKKE